jgi:hypothetical protein
VQTVSVKDEYVEVFTALGDLQGTVDAALQRYAIEQISQKIAEFRQKDEDYGAKYGVSYLEFAEKTSIDPDFVSSIEQTINKTWEIDLADWEFCHKGIEDWMQKLQHILLA